MKFVSLAATPESLIGAAAVVVVLLMIASSFVLRWQRERHRFELMRAAIAGGVTQFPPGPPFWLISFRQALTTLALGLALLVVGLASIAIGMRAAQPAAQTNTPSTSRSMDDNQPPRDMRRVTGPGMMRDGPPPGGPGWDDPGRDGPPSDGPVRNDPMHQGPPQSGPPRNNPPRDMRDRPQQGPPPHGMDEDGFRRAPSPEMERWHRAQAMIAGGYVAAVCGFILGMLGLVRLIFAQVERRVGEVKDAPRI